MDDCSQTNAGTPFESFDMLLTWRAVCIPLHLRRLQGTPDSIGAGSVLLTSGVIHLKGSHVDLGSSRAKGKEPDVRQSPGKDSSRVVSKVYQTMSKTSVDDEFN